VVIRRPSSLALTIAVTVLIGLVFILQRNAFPFQALIAVPLVLILPGYALTFALFGRNVLGGPERLLLSLGLSIALTILGGLLLNLTPWGLQENTWVLLLVGITLTASAVALIRHNEPLVTTLQWRSKLRVTEILLYEAAAVVLVGAIWIAAQPAPVTRAIGYTSLWIVPDDARVMVFTLGINSAETETTVYRLELQLGGKVIQEWSPLVLEPGQVWMNSFDLSALQHEPVSAFLYRADKPDAVYRQVLLHLMAQGKE
jgi:uncharacterized membrane protein